MGIKKSIRAKMAVNWNPNWEGSFDLDVFGSPQRFKGGMIDGDYIWIMHIDGYDKPLELINCHRSRIVIYEDPAAYGITEEGNMVL